MSGLDEVVKDPTKLSEYLQTKHGVDADISVIPQNPFSVPQMPDASTYRMDEGWTVPKNEVQADAFLQPQEGEHEHAGMWRSAWNQFKETSSLANVAGALTYKLGEPDQPDNTFGLVGRGIGAVYNAFMDTKSDWNPKMDLPKYTGVNDENLGFLLTAKSPQDMAYRYNWILNQQKQQDELDNGSLLGRLIGFGVGASPLGSPETLIPLGAAAKYSKVSTTFFKTLQKAYPGMLATSAIHEGALQMDSASGGLVNYLENTFLDSVFGTVLFGTLKGAGVMIEKSNLNQLKSFAKANIADNIDFSFKLGKEGELVGIDAVDASGSVGAKSMKLYQEMANTAFYKGGIFKIPYVGTGAYAVLTGNLPGLKYRIGSPVARMVSSTYRAANEFADRMFDHHFTTENVVAGGVKAASYTSKMRQERAALTKLGTVLQGLYVERLGYNSWPTRPLQGVQNVGLAIMQKGYEAIAKESDQSAFVDYEGFMDEIQRAMFSGESSPHAAVNEAAAMFRKTFDDTYQAFKESDPKGAINWLGSKFLQNYLTRVYDTPYMATGKGKEAWERIIPEELAKQDAEITERLQPIRDVEALIGYAQDSHAALLKEARIPTPSAKDLATEEKLRDATKPIKARLAKAKQLRNKAKKEETRVKNQAKIDAIQVELKPHQDKLDEHLKKLYGDDMRVKESSDRIDALKAQHKALNEQLQNELRDNEKLHYLVDDHTALSANEANQLKGIMKPVKDVEAALDEQKAVVAKVKSNISRAESASKKGKTVETGQKHAEVAKQHRASLEAEEKKLQELQDKLDTLNMDLQDQAHQGLMDRRFYRKNMVTGKYEFQDTSNRLKLRDVYETHADRVAHARAYYSSILNMHPEEIIADIMGRVTGHRAENVLKSRSINLPDEVLYNNNFMTKNLMAKTANYVNYLSRITHFNNAFKGIAYEDGMEAIGKGLLEEYQQKRGVFDKKIAGLVKQRETVAGNKKATDKIDAAIAKVEKEIAKETRRFEQARDDMSYIMENRVMGRNKRDNYGKWQRSMFQNIIAIYNLHNLGIAMVGDTAAIGGTHGIWNSIRDGLIPMMTSVFRGSNSEAFREAAPHINLALKDVIGGMTERNFGGNAVPYLNMGRVVSGIEKVGQFTANLDLAPYIENMNQRAAASTIQSRFMQLLHKYADGTITEKESLYLRKYGLDPEKWSNRMIDAYKKAGGNKEALGGYNSKFWKWTDMEAANEFGDAVFRGVENTVINRGMGDSPFWADDPVGLFFHNFTGWAYAFTNRFVIPKLQHPDAANILSMMWMMGAGSLVSPLRRASRGEDPFPEDQTIAQQMVEAFTDSGLLSNVTNFLQLANLFSSDSLLGDLKNDKFRHRMRVGFGTVGESTASAAADVISMTASREFNQADLKKAAKFFPLLYAPYMRKLTDQYIENSGLPRTREQAHKQKEFN